MIGLHHLIHPAQVSGGGASASLQSSRNHHHESNVVRIGATKSQQNQPVLLSSGALLASSSGRGHSRSQTRQQQQVVSQHHLSAGQSHHLHSGGDINNSNNHHHSHRQQRTQDHAADKVLLIVNDDHIKGGGVPVIGRRLPSKSASAMRNPPPMSPPMPIYSQLQLDSETCGGGGDTQRLDFAPQTPPQQVPVVGRRSHRLMQQHQHHPAQQQRTTTYQYEYHDLQKQEQHLEAAHEAHLFAKTHSKTQHSHSQPVHLLAIHQTGSSSNVSSNNISNKSSARMVSSGRHSKPSKYQSVSVMNIAEPVVEYNLPPMQKVQHRSATKRVSRSPAKTQKAPQMVMASASCSSLCSSAGAHLPEMGGYALCCASCQLPELDVAPTCLEPCCSAAFDGPLVRTASCQQVSMPCCAPKSLPAIHRHESYLSGSHDHDIRSQIAPQLSQGTSSNSINAKGIGSNHRHHHHHHKTHDHHSCQANGSTGPNSYRLSGSNQSAPTAQPMLISGRNVLPVHPKPNVHYLSLASEGQVIARKDPAAKMAPMKAESPEAAAVSQMYESLAAELKAKLGDPNMGPILLPPKDYDTMSRKQGKLSGIELRRSTNPALVGPTANNRLSSVGSGATINEESAKQQLDSQSPVRGSARSSGREKVPADDGGSQCSRSNSSSGLGSISIGLSSPNLSPSSKLSSNEDMRQSSSRLNNTSNVRQRDSSSTRSSNNRSATAGDNNRQHYDLRHGVKLADLGSSSSSSPVDRKNGSPDNCGASDSGHSGSGGLDSTISSSNEEHLQKMSPHDNSDYFSVGCYRKCHDGDNKSHGKEDSAKARRPQVAASSQGNGNSHQKEPARGKGIHNYNPSRVSDGSLWNGRVEIPLKVNIAKNTYLATKQIIY